MAIAGSIYNPKARGTKGRECDITTEKLEGGSLELKLRPLRRQQLSVFSELRRETHGAPVRF